MKHFILSSVLILIIFTLTACEGGPSGDVNGTVCTSNTIIADFNTDEAALDVSVEGNTTVVALGTAGVAIFNTERKNRPDLLIKVDEIEGIEDTTVYSARIHDKHLYLYLKDKDTSNYIRIVDISDPFLPVTRSEIALNQIFTRNTLIQSNWIAFEGNFIHVLGTGVLGNPGNYHIINVSDKSDPQWMSSLNINGDGTCLSTNALNEIIIKGTLAYIGSFKGMDIIDFSDRDNPALLAEEVLNDCTYKSIDLDSETLFAATGSTLYTYELDDIDTPLDSMSAAMKYILISQIDDTAYTLGYNGEISISDVSKPEDIRDTGNDIFVNAITYRIVDDEGYIYIADEAGLKIIDTCIR